MHHAVQGWTERALWGLTEALQLEATSLLGSSRCSRGRAVHEEGRGTHLCCTPGKSSAFTHKTRKISVCHSAEPQHYKVSQGLQTFKEEKEDL